MSILERIVANKREEIAARIAARPLAELLSIVSSAPLSRDFGAALLSSHAPAPRVIAEIKRRSPSKGELLPSLDPARLAQVYEANGASAISVLCDADFFGGSLDDLRSARAVVSLPVLCKEFVVDPYQIYEARTYGADAVLLIASVLSASQLSEYREVAEELGMSALVEVHNTPEMEAALASGARILGINNRDLSTFHVTLETTRSLLPMLPEGITTVSESGIHTAADRALMRELGVDALLVGESLVTAPDIAAATRAICGVSVEAGVR